MADEDSSDKLGTSVARRGDAGRKSGAPEKRTPKVDAPVVPRAETPRKRKPGTVMPFDL